MSDTLNLALTITAADMFSGVLHRFRERITGTGAAAQRVQKDYDLMAKSIGRGVKAMATAGYIAAKMRPGVQAASELQAELLGVRAELSGVGSDTAKMAKQMVEAKKTAFSVQAITPFDMGQIVALEKELVKAGATMQDVVGKKGAAAAAAALATYEKMEPVLAGTALIAIGTPFKIAADGYADLADKISRAASASTVGASDIAESAKYAAGPLAKLGRSKGEMLALVAVMAQVGVTGTMAGTSLKNFFLRAAKVKGLRKANGDLKSTVQIIDALRKKTKHMGNAKQAAYLTKIFGQEGLPVALAMLNRGKGSFEEIVAAMRDAAPLSEKLRIQMEGFGRQLDSLHGTGKSTMALLFEPALKPLTALIAKTNDWTAALGKAAMQYKDIGKVVSYGAGGVAAAIGLYGAGKLLTGGLAGMRVLRGLGGVGGLAGGIAKGKAVEAASGVTPVFVTNWPGHATARAAGEIGTGAALAEGAAGGGALTAAGVVLAPIAVTAIAAAASQKIGQHLAERDAKAMSTKELLALRGRQMVMGGGQGSYQVRLIDQQLALRRALDRPLTRPMRGEIVVKVRPERGTEAKTERPKSDNPAMTLQAETDVGMAAGGSW